MVNNANYSSKHLEEINLYTYINWEGNKIHSLLSSPKKFVVRKKLQHFPHYLLHFYISFNTYK